MKNFLKATILLATISVASVVFPSCSDNEAETDYLKNQATLRFFNFHLHRHFCS